MFAKQIQREVTVGEETVVIRKLSGKTLDKARDARRSVQVQNVREIGAELIKAFRVEKEAKKTDLEVVSASAVGEPSQAELQEKAEKARKASFVDYDPEVVLNAGIVRWTAKVDGKPVVVNPDSVGDLDEQSATALFNAILDLSVTPANAAELAGKD